MNPYRPFTADDAVKVAAAALSQSAGKPIAISDVRPLSGDERRNIILRAFAMGQDELAKPIIIKATRAAAYDAAAVDAYERFGIVKEWAAATFLARQARRRGRQPVFLAGDASQGVLVFDDYGEELPSLVHPLLHGSASDAEQALSAYAIALARLHGETIDCEREHAEVARTGFPTASVPPPGRVSALPPHQDWNDRLARTVSAFPGGTLPENEVTRVAERLQRPGPWLVLAHGDCCPDNVLLTSKGSAELIDFEFASPGHALLDATYWRIGFPTCWCAGHVPKAIGNRISQIYRAAVSEAVPIAADDDTFRQESAIISVAWLLGTLARMLEGALKEDSSWGISTTRSRILYYLETAIEMTTEADILHGTARVAAAWLDDLQGRWPASSPLAPYPAFTKSHGQFGPAKV